MRVSLKLEKKKKIRISAGNIEFWVLDGNDDSIRPYRILIKKI